MKIKMTKLGSWNNLQNYTKKILEASGYFIEEIEDVTVNKFMSKSVLAMGEIDLEFVKAILPKIKHLIYIGENLEVKDVIDEYCKEKDIPQAMSKITFTNEIYVYRNNLKTIQLYGSNIFSELEIASKFMAYNGTKISNLVKYVSQVELQRTSAPFDADLDDIKNMYRDFVEYYESSEVLDQERLIEIYETNKPQ